MYKSIQRVGVKTGGLFAVLLVCISILTCVSFVDTSDAKIVESVEPNPSLSLVDDNESKWSFIDLEDKMWLVKWDSSTKTATLTIGSGTFNESDASDFTVEETITLDNSTLYYVTYEDVAVAETDNSTQFRFDSNMLEALGYGVGTTAYLYWTGSALQYDLDTDPSDFSQQFETDTISGIWYADADGEYSVATVEYSDVETTPVDIYVGNLAYLTNYSSIDVFDFALADGFFTVSDATDNEYTSGQIWVTIPSTMVTSSTVDNTVTFVDSSDNSTITTTTVAHGSSFDLADVSGLAKTGYTYTTDYDGAVLTDDLTVTVTYTPITYTYSISYQCGEDVTPPAQTIGTYTVSDIPKTVTLTETVPTRDGYTFGGWCATSDGTETIDSVTINSLGGFTTSVYAIWTANPVEESSALNNLWNSIVDFFSPETTSGDETTKDTAVGTAIAVAIIGGGILALIGFAFHRPGFMIIGGVLLLGGCVFWL